MTATPRHFTAWMANDPSVLSGDFMDVTVIEDEAISYKTEIVSETFDFATGQMETETEEIPEWASHSAQMFFAETSVNARGGDAQDGIREAEALMEDAGWKVVSGWEATDNSYVATVERIED